MKTAVRTEVTSKGGLRRGRGAMDSRGVSGGRPSGEGGGEGGDLGRQHPGQLHKRGVNE